MEPCLPPTHRTLTCPVKRGVCVFRSQNRTVVSPDPLARWRPLGEKFTESTASPCPAMLAEQRATGRTLNRAWGWYTTRSTRSMDVWHE